MLAPSTLLGASHLVHPAVKWGSRAIANVGPSFLAAIAVAGSPHCAERLPGARSQFRTFDRVHPYSAGGAR
jgi:hypothetical protein